MALTYPHPPLRDGDVVLREWREGDLAAVEDAARDPYIPKVTTVPSPFTEAEGRAWIERQRAKAVEGAGWSFAIADAATDEALGYVGLSLQAGDRAAGFVGYWVVERARGRGRATRAVRLVTGWAVGELRLGRIEALVEPSNIASRRVLESAGFARDGRPPERVDVYGAPRWMLTYSRRAG